MAIVNLIVILLLGKKTLQALKIYMEQKKTGKEPVFRYSETKLGNTDIWNEEHAKMWESEHSKK